MKFIETLTKAGSKKFGVIVQYGISAPQYESNDEIESEAPDKTTFADIVFYRLHQREELVRFANCTISGIMQGLRCAYGFVSRCHVDT